MRLLLRIRCACLETIGPISDIFYINSIVAICLKIFSRVLSRVADPDPDDLVGSVISLRFEPVFFVFLKVGPGFGFCLKVVYGSG